MKGVHLNYIEQQMAISIALGRYDNARTKGIKDKKIGNQPNWITDLDGIGGEVACCKHFGVYPDTEIDLYDMPKYDLMTKKGSRVDVKTTKYKNGKLLATLNKKLDDCDIYVLVVGQFPKYELIGWVEAEKLIKKENIADLGHGEGYVLDQDQLNII
jgi:hypothetical protein|tara:strand:+ start:44 stop:514 length:471 start_codon:yes stop_codon:yes gene_type:complete